MGNKKPEEVSDTQLFFAAKIDSITRAIQNSEHKELRLSLRRNYYKPKESFYFTFSDYYDALVENPDITKTEIRVFSKLAKIMDFGNEVPQMTQQQLAELLGMKQQNFARSLNKLVNHGVVIKDAKKLIVNPKYCYKGDLHEREKTLNALRVAQKRKDNPEPEALPKRKVNPQPEALPKRKVNPQPEAHPDDQFKEPTPQPANNVSNENNEATKPLTAAHAKWLDWLDNVIDNNISKDNSTPKASLPFDEKDIPF